jgi:tRNA threonylcarbamoyladenosine biosynthesis protein TsaB
VSDPKILAFDTSAAHCAAALLCGDTVRDDRVELLQRGQAERLMPLLEEILAGQGLAWRDLDAIGVGIGPGNFTGIRISVAAARGLALALGVPAIGVSMFEVMRAPFAAEPAAAEIVSLAGPRGSAYVQTFRNGAAEGAPQQIDPSAPPAALQDAARVVGDQAREIADALGIEGTDMPLAEIGPRIARAAALRFAADRRANARPAPLYIRAADAAPPREAPPAILP